jgi:hypothetical protein
MKDIFELRAEESAAAEQRVNNALCDGIPANGYDRITRSIIADALYQARYDGRHYQDIPTKEDVLEAFCWKVFSANFDEVIKAWEKYLG